MLERCMPWNYLDLQSHFMVAQKDEFPGGLKRAYLKWKADQDGRYLRLEELDLDQLGVMVVKISNGSLGHGWLFYYGNIESTYFPKQNQTVQKRSQSVTVINPATSGRWNSDHFADRDQN